MYWGCLTRSHDQYWETRSQSGSSRGRGWEASPQGCLGVLKMWSLAVPRVSDLRSQGRASAPHEPQKRHAVTTTPSIGHDLVPCGGVGSAQGQGPRRLDQQVFLKTSCPPHPDGSGLS